MKPSVRGDQTSLYSVADRMACVVIFNSCFSAGTSSRRRVAC
jgi:hypothetical protein